MHVRRESSILVSPCQKTELEKHVTFARIRGLHLPSITSSQERHGSKLRGTYCYYWNSITFLNNNYACGTAQISRSDLTFHSFVGYTFESTSVINFSKVRPLLRYGRLRNFCSKKHLEHHSMVVLSFLLHVNNTAVRRFGRP